MTERPPRPPVTVREAARADHARVRHLVATAGLPLDGLAGAAVVLVAEAAGDVVGTVALERHGGAEPAYLLRSAAVDPDWRGRGVGAALTRAALDRVDAVRAPAALLTETAEAWFPRFGFQPVERSALPTALHGSAELQGACPRTARALLRPPPAP